MGNKTLADGTEIYESEFTGEQMDKLLKLVKTEEELREFILSVEDGGKLTETEVNKLIADYARKNNLGASDEVIRKVCQEYFAEHDITSGEDGKDGQDGVGIQDIQKTSTDENIDTYTITLTNGSTKTFSVRNGTDGANGHTPTTEEVKAAVEEYLKDNMVSRVTNALSGMHMVVFGDSISDEAVNGKWVNKFKTLANCKEFTNYAVGGATWTFWSDTQYALDATEDGWYANNVIWNQLNRLNVDVDEGRVTEPDLIYIMAGVNDSIKNLTLGTPSTVFSTATQEDDVTTLTNLSASVRKVCDEIYEKYPNCRIVLGTPVNAGTSLQITRLQNYRDVIEECAHYLGVYTIDGKKCGYTAYRELERKKYLKDDGIHPTDLGGELIGKWIYDSISTLPYIQTKTLYGVEDIEIIIETIPCTGITISSNSGEITTSNGTVELTATATPNDTTDKIVWSSDNLSVANVKNGVVTAVGNGTATITATCGEYSDTCTITVNINESEITGGVVFYGSKVPIKEVYTSDVELEHERMIVIKSDTTFTENQLYEGQEAGKYAYLLANDGGTSILSRTVESSFDDAEVYEYNLTTNTGWNKLTDDQVACLHQSEYSEVYVEGNTETTKLMNFWNTTHFQTSGLLYANNNIYSIAYDGTNEDTALRFEKNYNQSDYE